MVEERKNATKTVTCQIDDDLRLVAGNVICLVSAGLKIRLPELYPFLKISRIWRCATLLMRQPPRNSSYYLISTFAPAASTFFLISSASCLVTPSLIGLGAPSTSAFASANPRPGTALRISLITPILFAPISFKITSNVAFSSAAGAAAPPPAAGAAAAATGAAALTPHLSSSCLTNPAISRTDRPLSCSTNLSVSGILFLQLPLPKAFGNLRSTAADPDSVSFVSSRTRETEIYDAGVSAVAPPSFSLFAFNNRASADA